VVEATSRRYLEIYRRHTGADLAEELAAAGAPGERARSSSGRVTPGGP
jgi:hypothetical protein